MTLAKRTFKKAVALALCLGTAGFPAWTQQSDEVQNLITQLAPIAGQQESSAVPEAAEIRGTTVYLLRSFSIDLEVFFALNSADLSQRARSDLAALGHALASQQLRPYTYLIAGHTDSRGDARYNQNLSERRADMVRRYLIDNFPIDPARLISVGWGESRLKSPADPTAAINRRVEVTLVVPVGGYAPAYDPEANAAAAPEAPPEQPPEAVQSAPAAPPTMAPTPELPGSMNTDKDGNITITW
ncbi:OmpA family protein [uncultured Pelagimonas sp.]|uniref:OmpA family protein n=1 Tax=uncultured Pelagimonas sp. TaxID=1618102 RepID=UPI00261CFCB0|nr:OmpA family protein [uncultured Pelagimonas sp.]